MQYLSYNANKWLQSLDLKAIWFVAMVQTTILSSHTLIIRIYSATNDVTFIVFQNFTNM